ncbi:MAG: hypothetical protein A2W25_16080 [candidate division Zixibacteria bacterium RBG_16_53_22]|nr:MAG: hypothetical protein A2W25_16080 [candidate division Zixibacteria bacterium RBG_16_53_22]
MINVERNQKIEVYGNAYYEISEALGHLPREMWHYKPSPNAWSIHEIIIHLADSEANGYIRFRKAISEPGKPILTYDQEGWALHLDYASQSAEDYLELFKWLRAASYSTLRKAPDMIWQHAVIHPERGTMTTEDLLDIYANHAGKHIAQMKRVYEQWHLQPHHQGA